MSSFRDLNVWQKAYTLSLLVYSLTRKFPKDELFSLTSQMRRCSVSIPSNIAEGHARKSKKEFTQFLYVAFGSGAELETQLQISHDLGYIKKDEYAQAISLLCEVMKMLNVLISKVNE